MHVHPSQHLQPKQWIRLQTNNPCLALQTQENEDEWLHQSTQKACRQRWHAVKWHMVNIQLFHDIAGLTWHANRILKTTSTRFGLEEGFGSHYRLNLLWENMRKLHPFLWRVTLLSWKIIACALISNKLRCYDRPCLIMNSKINAYYLRVSHKSSRVPRTHPSGQWKIYRRTLLTSDYLLNPSMFLQRYQLLATRMWKLRNTGGSKSTHRVHNSKLPIHYANL